MSAHIVIFFSRGFWFLYCLGFRYSAELRFGLSSLTGGGGGVAFTRLYRLLSVQPCGNGRRSLACCDAGAVLELQPVHRTDRKRYVCFGVLVDFPEAEGVLIQERCNHTTGTYLLGSCCNAAKWFMGEAARLHAPSHEIRAPSVVLC